MKCLQPHEIWDVILSAAVSDSSPHVIALLAPSSTQLAPWKNGEDEIAYPSFRDSCYKKWKKT